MQVRIFVLFWLILLGLLRAWGAMEQPTQLRLKFRLNPVVIVIYNWVALILTTIVLSLLAHGLFYAHEQHRYLGAKIFAAEELAAIEDLKASEQMFNNQDLRKTP